MLFNSYPFLFVFLPVTLIGFQIAGLFHRRAVVAWLGFMSLVFYGYWRPAIIFLLIGSIAWNYFSAALISRQIPNAIPTKLWLWVAIVGNLATLGFFKYLFPFLNFASRATGSTHHWANVILPLGISFFTFTQIAFLVDLQQGIATQQDIFSYTLFVTFFPHLIAGPILHHKDMMPQFQQDRRYQLRLDDLAVGFSWFILGLGKKVLLADNFAKTADVIYAAHSPVGFFHAWRGVLGYALQLYFDFSGYSDMALGLARMFGIDFPLNFSSPYKSKNIVDFWQRWHITLTQYITDYLFTPVQIWISSHRMDQGKKVSRKAQATPEGFTQMIAFPMLLTMFIAGIWHGAGLQYIVFGLLHGFYLTCNHAWRLFRPRPAPDARPNPIPPSARKAFFVLLTFLCVLLGQIFFRAASCRQALSILAGVLGLHGRGPLYLSPSEHFITAAADMGSVVLGLIIVWTMPNTQQILSRFKPSLHLTPWDEEASNPRLLWLPIRSWALACGAIFFFALVRLQDPSTFLYFQF